MKRRIFSGGHRDPPLRIICNASVPLVGATSGRPCASAPISREGAETLPYNYNTHLSASYMPPLCKGRCRALRGGGIVKRRTVSGGHTDPPLRIICNISATSVGVGDSTTRRASAPIFSGGRRDPPLRFICNVC